MAAAGRQQHHARWPPLSPLRRLLADLRAHEDPEPRARLLLHAGRLPRDHPHRPRARLLVRRDPGRARRGRLRRDRRAPHPAPARRRGARAGPRHAGAVVHGRRRLPHGVDRRPDPGRHAGRAPRRDVAHGPRLPHVSARHQPHRLRLRRRPLGAPRAHATRCDDPRRRRRSRHGARRRHPRVAALHDRLLPRRVARRLRRRDGWADPNFGQAMFPELAYVVLFLPMLLVLVVRPQGLFGRQAV